MRSPESPINNTPGQTPLPAPAPAAHRRWRDALILVGLCLVVYLPGFFAIPPVDRDESRFAQASRQMFEAVALPASARTPSFHDGGLLIPKVQGRPRLNKPPLIYWLQAASGAACTGGDPLRDAIWMYRVPSLLAAIGAVLLTWRLGAVMLGPRVGLLAGAMLAVCPVVAWEAHQARADMVLLACTTGAMAALWAVWRAGVEGCRAGWGSAVLFWSALAAGIMTKGPIAPLVAGLAAAALGVTTRRWRWLLSLRPVVGAVILAAAVLPWVFAVAQKVGPDLYFRTILDETLGRSLKPKEGHWAPPGYHLVLLPVLFWPGSLLTAAGVVYAAKCAFGAPSNRPGQEMQGGGEAQTGLPVGDDARDLRSGSRLSRIIAALRSARPSPSPFLLAWVVPAWIVFEVVGTKLPHYTLPLYPAIAILSANAVVAASAAALPIRGVGAIKVPWIIIGVAVCVGLPVGCWLVGVERSAWTIPLGLIWLLVLIFWAHGWFEAWWPPERWISRQATAIVLMAVSAALLFQAILPHARRLWVSRQIAEVGAPLDPGFQRPLAAIGYHEDSLVFLRRGRIDRINLDDLDAWLAEHPGGLVVGPRADLAGRGGLSERARVEGYNYSNGRRVDVLIAESLP